MKEPRNINVLIVDDDPVAREQARQNISFFVEEGGIRTAANSVEMMRILTTVPIDLAFLDMEMPDIDGFSIADYLTQTQPKTKYVFLTGHTELGAKSYEYEPMDFLCKPVNMIRLQKTFDRFDRGRTPAETGGQIALETANGFVLVDPREVLYIARDNRKAVIHCTGGNYTVNNTLAELELMFGDYDLFRCHQSFLVSLKHVASAEKAGFGRTFQAVLDNGENVPVSRGQFSELRAQLAGRGTRFI